MKMLGWFEFCRLFDATKTAVVGNSASALQTKLGTEVDQSTFVVRFNQARTTGFESFVGTRTDLLICNLHQFEAALPPRVDARAVLALVDSRHARADEQRLRTWLDHAPVFFSFVPDVIPSLPVRRGRGFTSGIYGLYLVLSFFDVQELLISGFDFYDGHAGATGHYWERDVVPAPIEHDLGLDRLAFEELISQFRGRLVLSTEISRMLARGRFRTLDEFRFSRIPAPSKVVAGSLANRILRAGMALRRWSES